MKSADTWDFESDSNFKFKILEHEDDTECDEWNADSTLRLKEVVVSARQQFKWQSTGANATLKENTLTAWLALKTFTLRPLYWEISSDAYFGFQTWNKGNTARHILECADVKSSAMLEKGVRRGRHGTSSLPIFRTPSQRRLCLIDVAFITS